MLEKDMFVLDVSSLTWECGYIIRTVLVEAVLMSTIMYVCSKYLGENDVYPCSVSSYYYIKVGFNLGQNC